MNWTQLGHALQLPLSPYYNYTLSTDGNVLAINCNNSVYIYKFVYTDWIQIGQPLTSVSTTFGNSLSLSFDGTIIAVGEPDTIGTPGNVYIYQYSITTGIYSQIKAINGTGTSNVGTTVALSSNGKEIAVGETQSGFTSNICSAISGDGNTFVINSNNNNIYIYVTPNGVPTSTYYQINTQFSVPMFAFSLDGKTLAVYNSASQTTIDIYKIPDVIPITITLLFKISSYTTTSIFNNIDLSYDGSVILINQSNATVVAYTNVTSAWVQIGANLTINSDTLTSNTVQISGDGQKIVTIYNNNIYQYTIDKPTYFNNYNNSIIGNQGIITSSGILTGATSGSIGGVTFINGSVNASDILTTKGSIGGVTFINGTLTTSKDIIINNLTVGLGNSGQIGNVAFGQTAGAYNTSGTYNTYLGTKTGLYNACGDYNTYIGYNAGSTGPAGTTGSYNTFIGSNTGATGGLTGFNYSTAIGFNAQINASNQIVLGTSNQTVSILGGLNASIVTFTSNATITFPFKQIYIVKLLSSASPTITISLPQMQTYFAGSIITIVPIILITNNGSGIKLDFVTANLYAKYKGTSSTTSVLSSIFWGANGATNNTSGNATSFTANSTTPLSCQLVCDGTNWYQI